MNQKRKPITFYDVYVSYPPNTQPERVNDCIRANLSEQEATDIIQVLVEHRQAIIAEHCTNEERENAQHYFGYLGLDVIVRRSLELAPDAEGRTVNSSDPIPQCPVCYTIFEDPDTKQCPCCGLVTGSASESQIQHKRIEWQEKMAFESRKKHEIAYKLWREKQAEEKRLRKRIRQELERSLGGGIFGSWFSGKQAAASILIIIIISLILIAAGYIISQLIK